MTQKERLRMQALCALLEAKPGFEPGVRALQAPALPLGHFAI